MMPKKCEKRTIKSRACVPLRIKNQRHNMKYKIIRGSTSHYALLLIAILANLHFFGDSRFKLKAYLLFKNVAKKYF
jgi:hypothetical protein